MPSKGNPKMKTEKIPQTQPIYYNDIPKHFSVDPKPPAFFDFVQEPLDLKESIKCIRHPVKYGKTKIGVAYAKDQDSNEIMLQSYISKKSTTGTRNLARIEPWSFKHLRYIECSNVMLFRLTGYSLNNNGDIGDESQPTPNSVDHFAHYLNKVSKGDTPQDWVLCALRMGRAPDNLFNLMLKANILLCAQIRVKITPECDAIVRAPGNTTISLDD